MPARIRKGNRLDGLTGRLKYETVPSPKADAQEKRPRGRPRDPTLDERIQTATLELLAEVGYDLLSMDAVVARAGASKATVYRRWGSKAQLVVDAVSRVAPVPGVADTGTLAGDLQAMVTGKELVDEFRVRLVQGLIGALPRHPDLARVFRDRFVADRATTLRRAFERARDRGEIPPDRDLDLLVQVFPALLFFRATVAGQPLDAAFLRSLLEEIMLPLATAPPHRLARPARRRAGRAG
ncbi:MAG: TetR/AcrR family transcriptional regulator [Acidimicrobiaceae bacterium]|nr:TetR/AcrR family transcriptional regulator [Acidimicrobiaceae bacterium]